MRLVWALFRPAEIESQPIHFRHSSEIVATTKPLVMFHVAIAAVVADHGKMGIASRGGSPAVIALILPAILIFGYHRESCRACPRICHPTAGRIAMVRKKVFFSNCHATP